MGDVHMWREEGRLELLLLLQLEANGLGWASLQPFI
jgi:hypothetical protein